MIYFLIYFLLGYRKSINIYTHVKQLSLQSFGFKKNGNFSFQFSIPNTYDDQFLLVLLDYLTYFQQERNFFGRFDLCLNQTILNQGIIINKTIRSYSGTINYNTIIYPFLLQCESDNSFNSILNVLVRYQNPTTFLDFRIQPEIKVQLIIFISFAIFFTVYLINWFFHMSFHIYLHQVLTFSILSFLISHVLRYFELKLLDKSNNSHHFTQFHIIFTWISYFLIFLFFFFMSNGLSIINTNVPLGKAILFIIVSFWISFFPILYFYYDLGPNQNYMLFLIIAGILVFVAIMIINIRSTSSKIDKFLMKSSFSIPEDLVYLDHRLINRFTIGILFICFMIVSFIIIYIVCPKWYIWVLELSVSVIELISLSILAYLFRLKPKTTVYKGISEVPLSNFESFNN